MPTTETIKMTVEGLGVAIATDVMGWHEAKVLDLYPHWCKGKMAHCSLVEWKPYQNGNQRDTIMVRMNELGWWSKQIGSDIRPRKPITWCFMKGKIIVKAHHTESCIAIMLAAYEAVTGKRVEIKEAVCN